MSETVMASSEQPVVVKRRRNSRVVDKDRQRKAIELRKAGLQWWQIADALGYADERSCKESVGRAIAALPTEAAREQRQLEDLRMNHLMAGIWNRAVQGDLNAIDRVLKIQERIAKLYGYAVEEPGAVVHNTAVLVVQGTENEYVNALRAARNEPPLAITEGSDEVEEAEEVA